MAPHRGNEDTDLLHTRINQIPRTRLGPGKQEKRLQSPTSTLSIANATNMIRQTVETARGTGLDETPPTRPLGFACEGKEMTPGIDVSPKALLALDGSPCETLE